MVGIPLGFIVRNKPEDMGLLPDGVDLKPPEEAESNGSGLVSAETLGLEVEFTATEALRSRTFWVLALAESFRSFLLG